jgi:hypothetical protein
MGPPSAPPHWLRLYFRLLARTGIDGRLRELVQTIHCLIAEEFERLTGKGVRAALGHDRYRARRSPAILRRLL